MASPRLTTTKYVKNRAYVGDLITPGSGLINGIPRIPCYIGRGSRLAYVRNSEIVRSYVSSEELTFVDSAGWKATLGYVSNGDFSVALLKTESGVEIPPSKWSFIESDPGTSGYDQILVANDTYDTSETYYLSYQSSLRTVQDPLPVDDIRKIVKLSINVDDDLYEEYVDFFVPITYGTVFRDSDGDSDSEMDIDDDESYNTNKASSLSSVTANPGNTGLGSMQVSGTPTHEYTRLYTVTLASKVEDDDEDDNTFSFTWKSVPVTGGSTFATGGNALDVYPPNPVFRIDDENELDEIVVEDASIGGEVVTGSLTPEIEHGISLNFVSAANLRSMREGDKFSFYLLGPAIVQIDPRHRNTNQYIVYSEVSDEGNAGDGVVSLAADTRYLGTWNRKYFMKVTAKLGNTVTFAWTAVGEHETTGDVFSQNLLKVVTEGTAATLELGVKVNIDEADNFEVGDIFIFTITVARRHFLGKDDRSYTLNISAKTNPSASLPSYVTGTYSTNTYEGSFGTFTSANLTGIAPRLNLGDNLSVMFRNMGLYPTVNRFTAGDKFQFELSVDDVLDWSLLKKEEETVTNVIQDKLGIVTGTPGTWYFILKNVPYSATSVQSVVSIATGEVLTATIVADDSNNPTPYVKLDSELSSDDDEGVLVSYVHKGKEPTPGQQYYLTATYLRPESHFNTPVLLIGRDSALNYLGPVEKDNHLYIMADAVFSEFDTLQAIYVIQVKDADEDGVYTRLDFETAIPYAQLKEDISDIVVLSNFDSLNTQLSHINAMNNPFIGKFRILWTGMPQDFPIGDVNTADTLVYTAKKTLQVYGNAQYHGTRVLVAPTFVKKTIKLFNGTNYEFVGDGSFYAGSLAAMNAAFDAPWETLLAKQSLYWDEVQVYTDSEDLILGNAGIIFVEKVGSGIYKIGESTTVDQTSGSAYSEISGMNQVQYMKRLVSQQLTAELVGYVPESIGDAISAIKSVLLNVLSQAVSQKIIGNYQDSTGRARNIIASVDIDVVADENNKTRFYFMYSFFGRYPVKKMFGLQMVDTSTFFQGTAG